MVTISRVDDLKLFGPEGCPEFEVEIAQGVFENTQKFCTHGRPEFVFSSADGLVDEGVAETVQGLDQERICGDVEPVATQMLVELDFQTFGVDIHDDATAPHEPVITEDFCETFVVGRDPNASTEKIESDTSSADDRQHGLLRFVLTGTNIFIFYHKTTRVSLKIPQPSLFFEERLCFL